MKQLRTLFAVVLLVLVAAVATACGGGEESVPNDAVALVGDQKIDQTEFDALMNQARASYKAQSTEENPRPFPKAGSPEYNTLKNQAVQFLVQRAIFEQKAEELGVTVTEEDVSKRLEEIKKQYFAGDEKKYAEQLKQQSLTEEQVKRDIRAQLIQEGLYNKVTADVKVTDAEVKKYYDENQEQYGQPESREVRHILVEKKAKADQLYAQLQGGADFAKLAKANSKDPGSAAQGGKLTVAKGSTVPEFDELAFSLDKGEMAKPVKTQYGWHIIEAVTAVTPAKTTPFDEVKESIRQQLLQTQKNEKMTKWVEDVKQEFAADTSYQVGFAPPKTTSTSTTE